MPTIKQLPAASAVNATDELPLSQGGVTKGVQVSALLAGTQSSISLVKGRLLGRVSTTAGGPEPVSLGTGLILQGGALTPTGDDHAGFAAAPDLLAGDEVIVNSANAPRRLPATKLRGLFSAGTGVQIDASGVISATAGGAGLVGPKGDAGATGAVGPQGLKGDVGATGATGLQGVKGDTGATGAVGAPGAVGAIGAVGPQGAKGDTGAIGPAGAVGSQGPAGAAGPTGGTGPQGLKGDTGAQGPAGTIVAATTAVIGGVKPGAGLAVAADGTLSLGDVSSGVVKASGGLAARAVGDRFADSLGLRDFGSGGYVPGSGGDDLPAFNAALAKLTVLGGGRLLLPAGTFRFSGPIVPPVGSGMVPFQVIGHGDATVLQPSASMAAVFVLNEGNTVLADFALVNSGGLAGAGLSITKALDNSRCNLDRLTFSQFNKGVWVQNGDVLHFRNPRFIACGTAFSVDNGLLNSTITDMYVLGGNGLDVAVPTSQQPEGLLVTGGSILPSTGGAFGVRLRSGLEITLSGVVIDQLATAGSNGIIIDSSSYAVRAVKISNCWTGINYGTSGTGSGIKLVGAASEQIHIDQHTFDSHGGYGLEVDGGAGLLLDLSVTSSRFKTNALGDVSLKACRAMFLGCDMRHPSVSIATSGTQVQVTGLGNRFAANPQSGAIAGGFFAGNLGNTNDSLDGQSIGTNVRAPVIAAGALDVLNPSVFRGALTVLGAASIASGSSVAGNGAFGLPVGTTSDRPGSGAAGLLRWNTTLSGVEIGTGTGWSTLGAAGVGIASAAISGTNHLILTRTDSSTLDAGVLPTGGSYTETIYTASGAISPNDDLAIVSVASAAAMTLANASVAGRTLNIKRYGSGTVSITATIDGSPTSVALSSSAVPKEAITLKWSSAQTSWILV